MHAPAPSASTLRPAAMAGGSASPARLAATAALGLCALAGAGCEPRPGRQLESWEASNGAFTVRVTVFDEGHPAHLFEKGLHYRFESAPRGSSAWRVITTAYSAERARLPRDQVGFPAERYGFVFMQWWVATTTDAGRSWRVWDVPAHLRGRVHYHRDLIRSVEIAADGRGRLLVRAEATHDKRELTLHTRNYGQDWSEEE